MNTKGFTLVEVLTTVLIIGILSSIALPMYTRAIERSRATEAMSAIKAINDAIYAYASEKEDSANPCPGSYSQLIVTLPSDTESQSSTTVSTRHFRFDLGGAPANVPGTGCKGVKATRINGGNYNYWIWNPYRRGTGKGLSLQCNADNDKSIAICESLGIYEESASGGGGSVTLPVYNQEGGDAL